MYSSFASQAAAIAIKGSDAREGGNLALIELVMTQ
jgi:hypothetical protein